MSASDGVSYYKKPEPRETEVRRSPFLQRLHDAGLDDLVLCEEWRDQREGVMVGQAELLALVDELVALREAS